MHCYSQRCPGFAARRGHCRGDSWLAEEEPLDEFLKRVFNGGRRGRRRLERRLAALLAIDVAGYSLLMGRDEEGTHRRIGEALDRVRRQIRRADGRIFSFSGV